VARLYLSRKDGKLQRWFFELEREEFEDGAVEASGSIEVRPGAILERRVSPNGHRQYFIVDDSGYPVSFGKTGDKKMWARIFAYLRREISGRELLEQPGNKVEETTC